MGGDDRGAGPGVVGAQERLDVGDGHAQGAEPADDVRMVDLAGVVEAVTGAGVDMGRFENADVVIVA